jgi:hypothetical protein
VSGPLVGSWLVFLAVGCIPSAPSDTPVDTGPPPVRLERDQFSKSSNDSGRLKVELDVPDDVVSFQITGDSEQYVSFEQVIDPDGNVVLDWQDWVYSDQSLTLSFFPQRHTTALNWPIRAKDGPLQPGLWTVWLATTTASYFFAPNTRVQVTTELKYDPDPTSGVVGVQIVWADGVDDLPKVVTAVEEATARWAEVWANEGVELQYHFTSSKLDPQLGFTYSGHDLIENVAEKKAEGELQLIIGEQVGNEEYTFGVSAGIPGTIEPSPSTFVVLSWMTHAGPDGKFDADEIRLMGETMAHETGHYIGLFHPVEANYAAWDALTDTDKCTSWTECDDVLGHNLMYPYPLCTFASCEPQGQLTAQQGEVMQQFVGAL